MALSESALRQLANKLVDAHHRADQTNDWTFFVDELYDDTCVYTCEYAGTMEVTARGIAEIKATHYGRDMAKGWEEWTFPYQGVYVGTENRVITHWMNRGPGQKPGGGFYETPGVSFITFGDQGKIIHQLDVFDLAHQMHLCDELESQGLLSAELKNNWVVPMKQKLIAMLQE